MSTTTVVPAAKGGLWQAYVALLERQPLLTKAATSAFLNALEEFSAQRLKGEKVDMSKVVKKGVYGCTISAVLGHYLYALVDRIMAGRTGAFASLGKLVLINVGVAPITNWVYYAALGMINGMDEAGAKAFAGKQTWPTLLLTWKYFIPIQLIVVSAVPQALWLPVFNLIGFIFGVYLNASAGGKKK